jgi:Spy/CpxP family protein refolding chaperone
MMKCVAQLSIPLALCSMLSFAQERPHATSASQGAGADSGSVQGNEGSALQLIAFVLRLNDSQQQQLRPIFDDAAKAAVPIAAQIQEGKTALFAAAKAGKSEEQIKRLAEQQGALTSQMLLLQAHTFAKLWAILNEGQKSEVDDFVYGNIRLFLPACPQ